MPKLPPKKKPVSRFTVQPGPPPRVSKDYPPTHCYSDGKGGVWTHEGRSRDCRKPDCVQWRREQPEKPPLSYSPEFVESWKEDTRPDALAPCPLTGGKHRWTWGDDGKGHSADVCKCGAYEE